MGNLFAAAAIVVTAISVYIQYRQVKAVAVPMVPWGQFTLWVIGLALGITAFVSGVNILLVVPLSVAVIINVFFFIIVAISKLPSVQPAIEVGSPYIDFTATDSEGRQFTLSSLEGEPILLKFFRGHWCMYCYNELAAYTDFYEDYKELGIEMVVLSADTPEEAQKMKEKMGIKATVLSDENLDIIDKYRVRHDNAMTAARKTVRPIAVPTSILITPDGTVRWIDIAENNRVRLDPLTVLIKSKTILENCGETGRQLVRPGKHRVSDSDQQQHEPEHGDN
jgi:peroxiredoxin